MGVVSSKTNKQMSTEARTGHKRERERERGCMYMKNEKRGGERGSCRGDGRIHVGPLGFWAAKGDMPGNGFQTHTH